MNRRNFFALLAAIFAPKPKLEAIRKPCFASFGKKIGDTIIIRKPMRFSVEHTPFNFSDSALSLNEISARYLKPATEELLRREELLDASFVGARGVK